MEHRSYQILQKLLSEGYTNAGLSHECGCSRSAWYRDGEKVYETCTRCEKHERDEMRGSIEILEPEVKEQ